MEEEGGRGTGDGDGDLRRDSRGTVSLVDVRTLRVQPRSIPWSDVLPPSTPLSLSGSDSESRVPLFSAAVDGHHLSVEPVAAKTRRVRSSECHCLESVIRTGPDLGCEGSLGNGLSGYRGQGVSSV